MEKRFLIGSRAIFSGYKDFDDITTDYDYLIIEDAPEGYDIESDDKGDGVNHYIRWRNMAKEDLLDYHRGCYKGTFIQKFLVPEYAEYLNLTIDELKSIGHLVNFLDKYHTYEKIVYESYVENNGFFMTDEQKERAYQEYKKVRLARNDENLT